MTAQNTNITSTDFDLDELTAYFTVDNNTKADVVPSLESKKKADILIPSSMIDVVPIVNLSQQYVQFPAGSRIFVDPDTGMPLKDASGKPILRESGTVMSAAVVGRCYDPVTNAYVYVGGESVSHGATLDSILQVIAHRPEVFNKLPALQAAIGVSPSLIAANLLSISKLKFAQGLDENGKPKRGLSENFKPVSINWQSMYYVLGVRAPVNGEITVVPLPLPVDATTDTAAISEELKTTSLVSVMNLSHYKYGPAIDAAWAKYIQTNPSSQTSRYSLVNPHIIDVQGSEYRHTDAHGNPVYKNDSSIDATTLRVSYKPLPKKRQFIVAMEDTQVTMSYEDLMRKVGTIIARNPLPDCINMLTERKDHERVLALFQTHFPSLVDQYIQTMDAQIKRRRSVVKTAAAEAGLSIANLYSSDAFVTDVRKVQVTKPAHTEYAFDVDIIENDEPATVQAVTKHAAPTTTSKGGQKKAADTKPTVQVQPATTSAGRPTEGLINALKELVPQATYMTQILGNLATNIEALKEGIAAGTVKVGVYIVAMSSLPKIAADNQLNLTQTPEYYVIKFAYSDPTDEEIATLKFPTRITADNYAAKLDAVLENISQVSENVDIINNSNIDVLA